MLEMGPHEQSLYKQAMRAGDKIPARITDAPELDAGLGFYFDAFLSLDTERSDGPIPWSAIVSYGMFYEVDKEQMEELLIYTRALDKVISEHRSKKMEQSMKANAPRKVTNRRKK